MAGPARIAILFETPQEFQILKRHLPRLVDWGVDYELTMGSALKSPERLQRWIADREREGSEVFIVAAGGSASLAGAVAALTDHPVIGVPLDTTHLRGRDALESMTGLPAGLPVGVMGINGVENALYFAVRILALRHPDHGMLLTRLRSDWKHREAVLLENLRDQYPEIFSGTAETKTPATKPAPQASRPAAPGPPAPPEHPAVTITESPAEPEGAEPAPASDREKPRGAKRLRVDPNNPEVEAIEEAADILLEGGIVALPTDTVYGLAALATNRNAVRRLYEIKGRDADKPLPLLIHSLKQLQGLARKVPESIEGLLESQWPGALTLVFKKYAGSFEEVSRGDTLGIRMPDHFVTLAVISMLSRPLAVTSANRSGEEPMLTADEVMEVFADSIDCVLDAGRTPGQKVSTVLTVAETPFRILREGEVPAEALKRVLGDALADS